jgi:hypothetical protein
MGMTAYFDVEYTDAALDKARATAQRSGGEVPPRTSLTLYPTMITSSPATAECSDRVSISCEDVLTSLLQQLRRVASTSTSTTM